MIERQLKERTGNLFLHILIKLFGAIFKKVKIKNLTFLP